MNKYLRLVMTFLIIACGNSPFVLANNLISLELTQILVDGDHGIDGLDNPRDVYIDDTNGKVFVVSGDDNSLAVFDVANNFQLTYSQVFKNSALGINGLTGASSIAVLKANRQVVVTGFYDGALTSFFPKKSRYQFINSISDNLSYERVFNSDKDIGKLDSLGLLGAWQVITSKDEKQLFVASYASNSISVFDISRTGELTLNHKTNNHKLSGYDLGKPVSLALSPIKNELYVTGFEGDQLTIFDKDNFGKLQIKQTLKNGSGGLTNFIKPQKVITSTNGMYLYVACSGSNSLAIFKKDQNGYFVFFQAISNEDIGGKGLTGASSLAISKDGNYLYAAGEADTGLLMFKVADDGQLSFIRQIVNESHPVAKMDAISSIKVSTNGKYLLLTSAKHDALFVFKVKVS